MKKRLLHIIPTLDQAGAEKQLSLLARGLDRELFETHVCALTRTGPLAADLEADGIPIWPIEKRWKVDPLALRRLIQLIRRLQPDLVHTWLFAGNSYGRTAALRAGVPCIVATERCVDTWKVSHEFAIDRYLAEKTAKIVVNSSGVRDFYVTHRIPAEKFVVIPNGIAPATPSPLTREDLLSQLGLPPNVHLMAAVGRLWPQKRIKDLIWVADLLKVIRPDVHLLVVGEGPQRARLERYCHVVDVEDHVHFLGHRTDVPELMPHFDVLLQASGYEGLPNSVMEAMAAGVPVVATDIPGNRDLVVDNETGFLVPLADRGEFAKRVQQILNDSELAANLGEAAKQRITEHFSIEKMVRVHTVLYQELLS